jgi:hypothetical protein
MTRLDSETPQSGAATQKKPLTVPAKSEHTCVPSISLAAHAASYFQNDVFEEKKCPMKLNAEAAPGKLKAKPGP